MVTAHSVEKKTPMTILESKVENKSYQYIMESDSPLEDCIIALDQIRDHMIEIKNKLESEKEVPEESATQV